MLRDAKISLLTLVLIVSLVGSAGAQHCPVGDLNEDCKVNFRDLRLLTDRWLDASCVAPACEVDLDGAPGVDMSDFAWLAGSWLEDYSEITLVINEFMAKNNSDSGIRDEWGDYDDWLEIYNYGNEAIDTGGMYLTDDVCKPPILWWQVPDNHPEETTIVTHGFLLIWADGETYEGTLHASFKLSGSGEFPGLYDANGHLIDSKKYGPQGQNESYGRLPDGSNNWQVFDRPTPGWSNDVQPPSILITEIMYHPYHSTSGTIEPEDIREEYIELYNQGTELVSLADWRFSDGVDFVFPSGVTIGAGEYLVVAADVNTFMAKYPVVTNVVGGWDGRLSNSGETIELIDDMGVRIDRVRYADQGEWSVRELGLPGQYDQSHRGWVWSEDTDGEGKSLELVNQALPNEYGQNWKASTVDDGTPGVVNSIADADIAPLIVNVKHSPIIPGPNDPVTVTARIIDELTSGLTVTLHYCVDTSVYQGRDVYPHHDPGDYNHLMMFDDGAHGDGDANDGIHGVNVPAHPDGTIIEFYVEASDTGANSRTWPAPAMMDGTPEQVTNALYLVDDSFDADEYWVPGSQPIYHIIMTEMERGRLQQIVSISSLEGPNCQMNTSFISADGVDIKVRYNVGVRNRGHTRWHWPNNYRVNFAHDRPWKGVTAININSVYTYLQLVGNAIFRMSGLAQCETTAVQVRINGQNLALNNDEMYGSYVHLEVIDSDFADNHYPIDDAGNAYKCMRITHQADLRYEGSDPDPYRSNYFKKTNNAADDWSDLIGLTYALSENTPDESYVEEVNRVMNTEQWLRSIAINALMNNRETTLANGNGDDYYLYRGIEDTRFILIQHDLDTVFGMGENPGGPTDSIFEATDIPAMNRFLTHPQFVPRYYWHLKDLIETTFSSEQIGRFLDNMLGDFVPTAKINQIKNFVSARNAHVLSLIPQEFTIDSDLPQNSGYYLSTVSVATLDNINGTANAIETRSVRVNAQPADWWPIYGDVDNGQCKWSVAESTDITLNPGINRVIVQTFDHPNGTGNELERGYIDIWYDDGNDVDIFGTLASNTTLDAASGPWHVTGDVVVPAGKTLTIEPGTTLFFNANTSITVQQGGRLVAEGTRYQRIRLTHVPGGANWDGIKFDHSLEDNRLCFVDHEFGDVQDNRSTDVRYSRVLIDNMTWAGTDKRVLNIDHPTVICRNSVFPSIGNTEPLHGVGLSGNECIIFDGCIFGSAGGYSDIIDFTGGQRPGPIFQLYNSIFLGGGDDGPDLDGTDAHIEGNIFMNFHHEPGSDSTSNAVATGQDGGRISNINVARNIFINNDHAVLLKEDCFMRAQNNVFVNTEIAVISFGEPYRNPPRDPGGGVDMDGNIFWNNAEMFEHFFQEPLPTYGPTGDVIINSSILPSQWHYLGQNNIDADPIFVDPNSDFHLKLMSPAIGTGPWGFDMGAYVPAGAAISGEPDEITYLTDVNITVGGPGITDYKYCINDPNGPWLGEFSVDTPIVLNSLTDGQSYTVYAMGKNSAGVWQSDPCYATSRTWTIDNSYSRLVINEVLAHTHGTDPDLIELY